MKNNKFSTLIFGKDNKVYWRLWQKITAWSLLVVFGCFTIISLRHIIWQNVTPSHGFSYLGIRPGLIKRQNFFGETVYDEDGILSLRSVFDEVNEETVFEEKVALALKLYQIGNKKMVTSPRSAIYSVGTSETVLFGDAVPLILEAVEIRDNKTGEYYKHKNLILKPGKHDSGIVLLSKMIECAERKYYKTGNESVLYQLTKKITQSDDGVLNADWAKLAPVNEDRIATMQKPMPYTAAGCVETNLIGETSSGLKYELLDGVYVPYFIDGESKKFYYEKTDQHLSYDMFDEKFQTIVSASVAYNSDLGFYTVSLVADPLNKPYTTAETLWSLTDSAATDDPNAKYTKIEIKFELWDNGYFKKWEMWEEWNSDNARGMHLSMSAKQYYLEEFTFNENDCDLKKYDFWTV